MLSLILSLIVLLPREGFSYQMKNFDFMQGLVSSVYKTPITAYDIAKRIEAQFQALPEEEKSKIGIREQFCRENWERGVIDTIDAQLFCEEARRFFIERSLRKVSEEALSNLPEDEKLQSFFVEYIQHRSRLELSPKKIRLAFRNYVQECQEQTLWKYRILSLSPSATEKDISDLIIRLAQEKSPESLSLDSRFGALCSLSTTYAAQSKSLNADYRKELERLNLHSFSGPIATTQGTFTFLFLEEKSAPPIKTFQEMSGQLTMLLLNQQIQNCLTGIIRELREFQEIN
ncbi:hypothetical protein [Candidatus Similichlamydia laticola]|uniref:Uncharacterized protein n=1 Tax=Candidatus Similichlamydia laticola TaxID=2170265 RepID=A0A369KBS4_9BACT|nr:hypothetical protein [Candidatus Similichlamydia laticola]RDB31368.1 hypothetical protein HAT2_00527 [Candidatus Similichlamydia laticola]